jgi:broad specificity phosphatase PhoE
MFEDLLRKIRDEMTPEEKLRELCGPQWGGAYKGEMKNDHGERTNRKLKDQPFYHRSGNKKMRRF